MKISAKSMNLYEISKQLKVARHNGFIFNLRSVGEEYQREFSTYIIRSINHEMHLQEVKKSTLSIFDYN